MFIVSPPKGADTLVFSLGTESFSDEGPSLSVEPGSSTWGVPAETPKRGLNGHSHRNGHAVARADSVRPPVASPRIHHPILREITEGQARLQKGLDASVAIYPQYGDHLRTSDGVAVIPREGLGRLWDADSTQSFDDFLHFALSQTLNMQNTVEKIWQRTRIDWANPQSHVTIAAMASLVYVAPIYYFLFKYVQKPDAGVLDVLIASFVINTLVGAIPGGLHWEYVRTRLEATRSILARWSNKMDLDRIFPTLAHSNGIPDFLRFNDQAKMAVILVKLATELGPYLVEIILDKDIKAALADSTTLLHDQERKLLEDTERDLAAGQNIVAEVMAVRHEMGIERGKTRVDDDKIVINSLSATAVASAVTTAGAMVYLFGPPETSPNTNALLTVFTLQYLLGSTINHYFMQLVHMNLWDFKVRPLLVKFQNALGIKLSPSLDGEMGQPENFRSRSIYDSLRVSTTIFGRVLEILCLRLRAKNNRTPEEDARLNRWLALLAETKPILRAINHRLDAIDAVDKARK